MMLVIINQPYEQPLINHINKFMMTLTTLIYHINPNINIKFKR